MPEESGDARLNPIGLLVAILVPALGTYAAVLGLLAGEPVEYGLVMFLGLPFAIGMGCMLLAGIWGGVSLVRGIQLSLVSLLLSLSAMLLFGREGAVCLIGVLPLAVPGAILGAMLGYAIVERRPRGPGPMILFALIAAAFAVDYAHDRKPAVFTIETSMLVRAEPEAVWSAIIGLADVPRPGGLLSRFMACPTEVRLDGTGVGAIRTCALTTGNMIEEVTRWEPGVSLAWITHESPPPIIEVNPFHKVHPPHLDGYLTSTSGEFAIERTSGGSVLIRRTTIELKMYPVFYWRFWARKGTEIAHEQVMHHVRKAAEASEGFASD